MTATTTIRRRAVIDIVQKLTEVVVHGANTSLLTDLPYDVCPQAAKQAAKFVPL